MAIATGFASNAQCNRQQDRDVILNDCCFTDNNSGGMVEHDPTDNFRGRVYIDLELHGELVLQENASVWWPSFP